MSTLTCPHCGTTNRSGSNFCNKCGTDLRDLVMPDEELPEKPPSIAIAAERAASFLGPEPDEEAETVERFFSNLPPPWKCILYESTGSRENPGPVLWMASGRQS